MGQGQWTQIFDDISVLSMPPAFFFEQILIRTCLCLLSSNPPFFPFQIAQSQGTISQTKYKRAPASELISKNQTQPRIRRTLWKYQDKIEKSDLYNHDFYYLLQYLSALNKYISSWLRGREIRKSMKQNAKWLKKHLKGLLRINGSLIQICLSAKTSLKAKRTNNLQTSMLPPQLLLTFFETQVGTLAIWSGGPLIWPLIWLLQSETHRSLAAWQWR